MIELDTIYNEDCLVGMQRIPDKSVDCIICDLPYGTSACKWDSVIPLDKLWEQYIRVIKPHGAIVLFGQEPFSTLLRMSNFDNWKYDWIWDKKSKQGFLNAKKRPLKQHELISVFCNGTPVYYPQMITKGKPRQKGAPSKRVGDGDSAYGKFEYLPQEKNNTYYPSSILEFSNASHTDVEHPTQKPVDLIAYLIRTYSNPSDTILDNAIGSGTTAVAAIREKRHFIGFELNRDYCDIAVRRIKEEWAQLSLYASDETSIKLNFQP